MKKQLLLSIIAFCLLPFAFAQEYGWVDYSSKIPKFPNDTVYIGDYEAVASFTDVFFVDDNEGWVTTWDLSNNNMDSATILHTIDGGETWEVQIVPSPCNTIWMLNKNVGYAGSQDGRIYKTTDGGENWLFHSIPAGPITDISFPPEGEIGYAVVDNSTYLFKIKPDTLERILLSNPNFYISVTCPAANEVWFVGGTHIRYYNGDTVVFSSGYVCGYNSCIWFANSTLGWVTNDCYVQGYYAPRDSWVVIADLPDPSTAMCSVGEDHIWVIGFNGLLMNTHNAKDFKRLDDGHAEVNVEWETPVHPLGNVLFRAVSATSVNNVFVVGNEKVILKYTEVSVVREMAEQLQFEIYPNPAVNELRVAPRKLSGEFRVSQAAVEIYDLNGRKLLEKQIPARPAGGPKGSEEVTLDVSGLQSGVYFLRLIMKNKSVTKKLIIQK